MVPAVRLSPLVLLLVFGSPLPTFVEAFAEEDGGHFEPEWSDAAPAPPSRGWIEEPRRAMVLRFSDRPLTLPRDTFALFGIAGGGLLNPSIPAGTLRVGAGYGVDEDLEVGLVLLRTTLSKLPDTGLEAPSVFGRYRFVRGFAELAGTAELAIPVGEGALWAAAELALRLHLFGFGRLDVAPRFTSYFTRERIGEVDVPVELGVQLGPHFALVVAPALVIPDVTQRAVALRPAAKAVITFGDARGATADLGLTVFAPERALTGALPPDPRFGNHWGGALELRFFIGNEDSRRSPFDF